ncbi:MAG TPA: hypothetical protein VMS81_01100 [Methanomicrobiales archaeon]|nr:hypothetical protein [Methanomicrobiales archaeon]
MAESKWLTWFNLALSIIAIIASTWAIFYSSNIAVETSYNITKMQEAAIQKQTARALYFDVSNFQDQWGPWIEIHNKMNSGNLAVINTPTQELYPSNGIYFVFIKEIANFNQSVSGQIYEFYNYLLRAELLRKDALVDLPDTFNNENRKAADRSDMWLNLNNAYSASEPLKELLDNLTKEAD